MAGLHIVVAGLGNTGSALLPHLARLPEISRLTLVDPDVYVAANVAVQNIDVADTGHAKAPVQAARLRRIRPELQLTEFVARFEDVPRGRLHCDLLVSCVDSKLARQHVNEIAWRLNVPWIDCGVLGSQSLVRVNAHVPGADAPCSECAWSADDYALIEQDYICGASGGSFSSNASSALGGLAASLVAIEVAKFARDGREALAASKQLVFDAEHRVAQLTSQRRNRWCRFDHSVWEVQPWVCSLGSATMREAIGELGSLRVDGHHFAIGLACPGCGLEDTRPRLNRPLARCPECHRRLAPVGTGPLETLDLRLGEVWLDMTLAEVGIEAGDNVSSGQRHFELMEEA